MPRFGVHSYVRDWSERRPDAAAVRDPATGVVLSYAQLWERAGWLAADLAARGVGPGDIVAVAHGRSVELVTTLLGIVRTGAAYLPVDAHAPAGRLAGILAEARVRVCVGTLTQLPEPAGLSVVELPGVAPAAAAPDTDVAGDDPCYVMFTSGSTGTPKGVVVPHRAVVRLATRAHYCVISPGDRCANASNPAFDATTFELWSTLAAGGTVVVFPSVLDQTIDEWVALVRGERIDTMFLTTSLFHTVARERPDAFGSLANLVVGGEQLDLTAVRRVLDAAPPRRLTNGYGPTETTTFAAYFECTPDSLTGRERVPIGFPLQDTSLYVLGETDRLLPPNEVGELCIGGPGVALGYLGLPELTAERFIEDPATGARLYRTGDLARQLPDGAVELLGRRDRQVKLRGFRIELEEIERAAVATGLCDTMVVEKIGDGPAAYLAGFVLPPRGATAVTDALAARLGGRLPAYMIPARWVELADLPYGPTGKLDRAALVARLDAATAAPAADAAISALGAEVRRIWLDVLDVASAAPEDNFLDLGGNSITAVQVASRIQQQLDLLIEPADVLLAESLAELTRQLTDTPAGRA